jgi:hypothetical protein
LNYYFSKIISVNTKLKWKNKLRAANKQAEKVKPEDISIIVVGRNDNYGGDFSLRLKTTIDWNLQQLPGAELIYVEWNKIADKESDCTWMEKRYPAGKFFIVPNEIHTQINNNPKMPVMEYFAKNIGIRRSTRKWLLMINADCFLAEDTAKSLHKLSKNYVYGTHYISIKWNGEAIKDFDYKNKNSVVVAFPADKKMSAVVGNFILSSKENWMKATGYDERLTNVRAGVDTNGVNQLLHMGLKPMVLGHHYHLDHPESIIHGTNDTHGKHEFKNIPYLNEPNWGFNNYPLKQLSERIWQLEKI